MRMLVRFNFSKTTGRTNIKLGTIDYFRELSVIKGDFDFMMVW